MRQHLVCVQASQQISQAYIEGAELHSQRLYFAPQHVQSGKYQFQIGSAGSTTLVLQTLLPVLLLQNEATELTISGVHITHLHQQQILLNTAFTCSNKDWN